MSNFDRKWYSTLKKPLLTPPPFVFGIVWPILYTLMCFSAYLIWTNEECYPYCSALTFFIIQLIFNLSWSKIFFVVYHILFRKTEI